MNGWLSKVLIILKMYVYKVMLHYIVCNLNVNNSELH